MASILEIDEYFNEHFNVYKEAPEIERKKEVLEENLDDDDVDPESEKYFV